MQGKGNKGCLKRQLGMKVEERIPTSLLNKIVSSKTGSILRYKGRRILVNPILIRRAMMTRRLRRIRKRRIAQR